MTKTKSLLLGSAAAIMAATGSAQAADMPVETWDYVRICDAYGARYYYIPGTETCLRIGGYVQARATYTHRNDRDRGVNQANNFDQTDFDLKGRARLWLDAREESRWGTLRAYMEFEANDGGSLNMRFAYLQLLGFTAGHASVTMPGGIGGGPNYLTISGDNGVSRNQLVRYELPFGNGFSFAVAIEESDNTDTSVVFRTGGSVGGNAHSGDDFADLAGNIRVDQNWGSAFVAGILRDVQADAGAGDDEDAEIGWAARAGLRINLNMLANGGSIGGLFTYTSGASNYAADFAPDAYYRATGDNVTLVDTWSARGTLEVGITPTLLAGIWGGYTTVVDLDNIFSNIAAADGAFTTTQRATETWYNIGFSTTWTPIANLALGLDVEYAHEEDQLYSTAGANTGDQSENVWAIAVGATRRF